MQSDFDSSDDEFENNPQLKSKKLQRNFEVDSDNDDSDFDDDNNKELNNEINEDAENEEEEINNDNEEEVLLNDDAIEEITKSIIGGSTFGAEKIKKLTTDQLEKEEKKIKRSGVVYLSSIPPYMKPQKLRHIMSRFGEVGRLYLKPEDPQRYKSRIKQGGNKKKKFDEGWVEFVNKKEAKLAAETLNGDILGGKKRSFYHDDVMNVKYLKGFKWFDLTNALNREIQVRESKKQNELSQVNKINKQYIKNVEQSKTINRIQSQKRKADDASLGETDRVHRNFKQNAVVTLRADANESIKNKSSSKDKEKIDTLLNKIF